MTSYLRLLFAAAIGAFCGVSYAATQSLESIQAAAEQHVLAQLPASKGKHFVTAQRLDLRLRLAECGEPLEAFMPNNAMPSTRTTVGVRCNAPAPWTIYVPVTVELEAPILVLRRALPRRSPVDVSDVELQTRRVPGIDALVVGVVHIPAAIHGGMALLQQQLQAPHDVTHLAFREENDAAVDDDVGVGAVETE